jgi:hypothetical protein
MAATRIVAGKLREVWVETAPQDGGAAVAVSTGISCSSVLLSRVQAIVLLDQLVNAPVVTGSLSVVAGKLVITLVNSGGVGSTATWTLDVTLNHSVQQAPGSAPAPVLVVERSGGQSPNLVADWPLDVVRHFLVDQIDGDDANVGYIDAPLAATSIATAGKSVKTITRMLQIIPRCGCGRLAILHLANHSQAAGAIYGETLDLQGFGGYLYFLIRAWTAWLDSVAAPCWGDRDRQIGGARMIVPGPNPDGSWPIAGIDFVKALRLQVVDAGALLASDAATGYRVRFGMGTPHIDDVCVGITKSDTGLLELTNIPIDPLTGPVVPTPGVDTFWIESPGVILSGRYRELSAGTLRVVGLEWSSAVAGSIVLGVLDGESVYTFCNQSDITSTDGTLCVIRDTTSRLRFSSNWLLPTNALVPSFSPCRFGAVLAWELTDLFVDLYFASVSPSANPVSQGAMAVFGQRVFINGGSYLNGLSVMSDAYSIGAGTLSEVFVRIARIGWVLQVMLAGTSFAMSNGKINGVFLDDAVLKLGVSSGAAVGAVLRVANCVGGPTVRAACGTTGYKCGFYARATNCNQIVLGDPVDGAMPTITGADGDIMLDDPDSGWTSRLTYIQLAKGDYVDRTGTRWTGAAGIVSQDEPRVGSTLTNADVVIAPGTDKCSLYILPFVLTGNHQVTVQVTDMLAGQSTCIRVRDLSANTYAIVNGGPGAGTLFTKPASPGAVIDVWLKFDGTNMVLDRTVYKEV